ncbi:MAG TPA: hypothetical protein VGW40_14320 [Allosphingosinicella sp.]|nr:hypothetical protein [Allosphingosinicella sp.]
MSWKFLAAAALAGTVLLTPARAQDAGTYQVRNDTRQTLRCGLRREHGSRIDVFVLRPQENWRLAVSSLAARVLRCDINRIPLNVRIRPNVAYRLVEEHTTGMVVLRIAGGR